MYSFIFLLYLVTITNCQLFGGLPSVPGTNKISQVASKVTSPFQQALDASYNSFQTQYKKVYDNPQIAQLRKSIFEENFKKIEEFNEDFKKGLKTFELGVNEFIDLTLEEFNKLLNGFGITRTGKKETEPKGVVAQPFRDNIPDQVDWREKGAVGPVKHQGQCASCYAFSAAGVLEGQVFRKTGKFYDLSPQHIMDCSSKAPFENDGCKGGYTDLSIDYMEKNNGINIDNVYPYEGKENQCRTRSNSVIGHVTGCYRIREGDEKALEAAVANIGPISAAIDAGHSTFQNYKGGIYDEPDCGNQIEQLNHSILIVGYGVDKKTGQKYWICKNSYGPGWGENGYFRLAKDKNNHCGIASWAVYPKVEN